MIHTLIHFSCVRHGWKMVVGEEDIARGVPFFKTAVVHCSYRSINPHKSARISFSLPYSLIPRVYPASPRSLYIFLHGFFAIRRFVFSSSTTKIENEESFEIHRVVFESCRLNVPESPSYRFGSPIIAWKKERNEDEEPMVR